MLREGCRSFLLRGPGWKAARKGKKRQRRMGWRDGRGGWVDVVRRPAFLVLEGTSLPDGGGVGRRTGVILASVLEQEGGERGWSCALCHVPPVKPPASQPAASSRSLTLRHGCCHGCHATAHDAWMLRQKTLD